MIKAVIATGGKQYLVKTGDVLNVELLNTTEDSIGFEPLLVIDGDKIQVGKPTVKTAKVEAKIIDKVKEDKVIAIRYKAKKRVNKVKGHRQIKNKIQIISIK